MVRKPKTSLVVTGCCLVFRDPEDAVDVVFAFDFDKQGLVGVRVGHDMVIEHGDPLTSILSKFASKTTLCFQMLIELGYGHWWLLRRQYHI